MGNTVSLAAARAALSDASAAPYLDVATVLSTSFSHVEVELVSGTRVSAKLALAVPYQPALRDEVLVIGNDSAHWVIGVVTGRGSLELRMPGDIDIHAMNGKLRLHGDEGVEVASKKISLRTKDLRVTAEKAIESFTNVVRSVREMLSTRAGERHTMVQGNSLETAKRVTILGNENVAVNGKQIHLG